MYFFKTLRRPAAWMLALAMVLSLLPPVTLPAQAMEICELWVGGQRITEDNLTVRGSSGTATYDPAANTLTLDNYYYSGEGHHEEGLGFAYGIYASSDLNIVLKGENCLYLSSDRAPEDLNAFHGIYGECGLTIEGDGWLEVAITGSGCTWGWSYGIYAETLTIRDSEIYTRGGNHGWSCGIRTDGDLTLENADISAIGDIGSQQSRGIHAEGKLYLRNTTLEAYTVTSDRQAIYAQKILPVYDENYRWTTSEEDIPTTGNLNYRDQRYFRITPVEAPHVHTHCECGKASCTDSSHTEVTYEALTEDMITLTGGSYYLAEDLTMNDYIDIIGPVRLCLNGHTLDLGESSLDVNVGSLTLCDCGEGGTITDTAYCTLYVRNGSLTIYGGTITGMEYATLYIMESDLTIHGGTVANHSSDPSSSIGILCSGNNNIALYGGTVIAERIGILLQTGIFLLDGGTIEGHDFAGLSVDTSENDFGTVTICSGSVSGGYHGLITTGACKGGTVNVEGGTIHGTWGLCAAAPNTIFNVSGGTIIGDSVDIRICESSANAEDATISLNGYTGDPLTVNIKNPVVGQYIARDVAHDGLLTVMCEGHFSAHYEPETQAVLLKGDHTHGTPGFTWPNNLSWSKAEVWCQTCATKFEADAELTWTSTPGKLILTAEAVLDGVTYTSAPLEFKVTDYDCKLTIPMPLGTLDLYMIAASYDSNGRMIDCQMAETGWNDVVFDKVGTDVRIFLSDYSFTPVSPVLYVQ